jgi:hypothetical protein
MWWRTWTLEDFDVAEPGCLPFALLGRNDFFRSFTVSFHWFEDPPWLQLDPGGKRPGAKREPTIR